MIMVTILRIASSLKKRLRHLSDEVSLGISWLDPMLLLPNLNHVVTTKFATAKPTSCLRYQKFKTIIGDSGYARNSNKVKKIYAR